MVSGHRAPGRLMRAVQPQEGQPLGFVSQHRGALRKFCSKGMRAGREIPLERMKLRRPVLSGTNNPRIWIPLVPSTCDIGSGSMPNSKDKKPRGRQRKKADFNFTRKEKRSDLEEHSPSEPDQIRPGQPAQPVQLRPCRRHPRGIVSLSEKTARVGISNDPRIQIHAACIKGALRNHCPRGQWRWCGAGRSAPLLCLLLS